MKELQAERRGMLHARNELLAAGFSAAGCEIEEGLALWLVEEVASEVTLDAPQRKITTSLDLEFYINPFHAANKSIEHLRDYLKSVESFVEPSQSKACLEMLDEADRRLAEQPDPSQLGAIIAPIREFARAIADEVEEELTSFGRP